MQDLVKTSTNIDDFAIIWKYCLVFAKFRQNFHRNWKRKSQHFFESEKSATRRRILLKFEAWAVERYVLLVNLVDLVNNFATNICSQKIGVDKAENEHPPTRIYVYNTKEKRIHM